MNTQTAPGELERVRDFVNTLDVESGADELASPEALRAWLHGHGLSPGRSATRTDVVAARRLREAMRALLLENNGLSVRKEAADPQPHRGPRRGEPSLRLRRRVRLEPAARGVDAALGRLVAIAASAMADGTWTRLKACRADDCHWAFYDHARNHSRHWCSMAVCGNRTKARTYRRRHAR